MSNLKYTTYGQMEPVLEENFHAQTPLNVFELYEVMLPLADSEPPSLPTPDISWGTCSDEDFRKAMDAIPIVLRKPVVSSGKKNSKQVSSEAVFGAHQGLQHIMVHQQFNFLKEEGHTHDYFEIYYVFSGVCQLHFSEKSITLRKGDMIYVAPHAVHYMESNSKDNFILSLSVRNSGFDTFFSQQLSFDSVLSSFFRKIIYSKEDLTYILFHTGDDMEIIHAFKNISMETCLRDTYNEILCSSWGNIVFSLLLRKYYETVETSPALAGHGFPHILKYIYEHDDTITLDDLAREFNFSKAHICNMIKANTGYTMSTIVNMRRLEKAAKLLKTTDYPLKQILKSVGFSSADYFTRIFKKTYGMTPIKYRKSNH